MNRYKSLFGHMYSRLVEELSNIESSAPDDIVVASVLLFNSFNETLHYIGTHENPMVMPDEVRPSDCKRMKAIKHFSPRCLWYLAQYFCGNWGRTQIDEVFMQNEELVEASVSTFALTYSKYPKLKQAWLEWSDKNRDTNWDLPSDEELEQHPIVYQSYVLANLLLIMMPISLSMENQKSTDEPQESINNASDIYNLIMGGDPQLSWWADQGGHFTPFPQKKSISWRYVKPGGRQFSYGQLLDVIEFVLIQPISGKRKEAVLKAVNDTEEFTPPSFLLSAIARPLFFNCEFQGIIFLVKEYLGTGFREIDDTHFVTKIQSLQIESRLAEARYDLAQITLLQPNARDTSHPSLARILNIMPLFTSASAGIVIYEDDKNGLVAIERYRMSKGQGVRMETNPRREEASEIKKAIETILPPDSPGPVWISNEGEPLTALLNFAPNGEKAHAKSAMVIPISNDEVTNYFVLFFRESMEFIYDYCFGSENTPRALCDHKVFAERVSNAIERLVDTDREHKWTLSLEHESTRIRASDLSLMTPHTVKNTFEPRIIQPLNQALKLIVDPEIRGKVEFAKRYAERFAEQANKVSLAWKYVGDSRDRYYKGFSESPKDAVRVTPNDFCHLCEKMKLTNYPAEREHISCLTDAGEEARITISQDILEYLIDQLIANALQASKELPAHEKRLEISWREDTSLNSGSPVTVEISVWNANTTISESFQQAAGYAPMKGVEPSHSGLGFYFMESALSQLDALAYENNKHFKIENTQPPKKGVRISFAFPASVERMEYE